MDYEVLLTVFNITMATYNTKEMDEEFIRILFSSPGMLVY